VYSQKIPGNTVSPTPRQTIPSTKTAPPPAPAKPPTVSSSPPPVLRSGSALIAAAGLPTDKLSAAIVSFARFFSLPLKPELMAAIRRQALSPSLMAPSGTAAASKMATPSTASPVTMPTVAENVSDLNAAAKNREALSLAAAAAESKGLELDPKGLEQFAEAIDPDWQKRQNPDGRGRQRKDSDEREKGNTTPQSEHLSASGIKEMAFESAEKDPLLAILNRLPGKNGQRWIVLPFGLSEDGREFNVSLRILLETLDELSNQAACMTLDIAESGEIERRWLFVLNGPNRQGEAAAARLTVYLQPELPPTALASLTRELSLLMAIPPERVSVKNQTESFPGESGCMNDWSRTINEAI
jgi:hypothetical protein